MSPFVDVVERSLLSRSRRSVAHQGGYTSAGTMRRRVMWGFTAWGTAWRSADCV
jgi:hypothetical protein